MDTCEIGLTFPVEPKGDPEKRLSTILGWLEALKLDTSAAHIEFRVSDDGDVIPIEINPRIAGGNITRLIHAVTGFDPMDFVLLSAVGAGTQIPSNLNVRGVATVYFPMPRGEGTITEISVDESKLPEEVFEMSLTRSLPREVKLPLSKYDYLGHILVKADNRDLSWVIAQQTEKLITVTTI